MNHQPIRMLSVDDASLSTELDRAGYKSMGVSVIAAQSYAEVEASLGKQNIDVVVINLDYASVEALAICRSIKADDRFSHIPVVVTTVQEVARVQKQILHAGADLVVEQPIPRSFFIEKIKSLLLQTVRGSSRVEWDAYTPAEITWQSSQAVAKIGDISSTGLLISSENIEVAVKTELNFVVQLPDGRGKITGTGEVVRIVDLGLDGQGYGVRFKSFDKGCEERLTAFVASSSLDLQQLQYYL